MVNLVNAVSAGLAAGQALQLARLSQIGDALETTVSAPPSVTKVAVVDARFSSSSGNGSASQPFGSLDAASDGLGEIAADADDGSPILLVVRAGLYAANTKPFRRPVVLQLEAGARFATGAASLPCQLPARTASAPLVTRWGVVQAPGAGIQGDPAVAATTTVPPLAIAVTTPAQYAGSIVSYIGQPALLAGPTFSFASLVLRNGASCPSHASWSLEFAYAQADAVNAGLGRVLTVGSNHTDVTAASITARNGGSLGGILNGNVNAVRVRLQGLTALNGTLTADSGAWADVVAAGVTPAGAVTWVPGTVVRRREPVAASPQTITLPGSFGTSSPTVSIQPEGAGVSATTFWTVTAVTANTVVVTHGGSAPTHWQVLAQG